MEEKFIEGYLPFIRKKEYEFKKWLSSGGTGQTVLMRDNSVNMDVVCKKFEPMQKEYVEETFAYFKDEIKIMYSTYHKNIVRIFNHYIYDELKTGFIIMEYINGRDIRQYLIANPSRINEIFIQVIDGFVHLESERILHRDIRDTNILVTDDNVVKIIDFGYGKKAEKLIDEKTKLHLNWTNGELPEEVMHGEYRFISDIYFLGRLFEKIIEDIDDVFFSYKEILSKMTIRTVDGRYISFSEISEEIKRNNSLIISDSDRVIYETLASTIDEAIVKIEEGYEFDYDDERVLRKLQDFREKTAWENCTSNIEGFIECFFITIRAEYETSYYNYYAGEREQYTINTDIVKKFIQLFSGLDKKTRENLLNNLKFNRIAKIPLKIQELSDEELPF